MKDCPFCGSEAEETNDVGFNDEYYIEIIKCTGCGVKMEGLGQDLHDAWNKRAQPSWNDIDFGQFVAKG